MSFDFDRLTNTLEASGVELAEVAAMLDPDGEVELAAVMRDASAVLYAAWEKVEAKRRIVAQQEAERVAAIAAVLRPDETVERFEAEAIRDELERRQRASAAG